MEKWTEDWIFSNPEKVFNEENTEKIRYILHQDHIRHKQYAHDLVDAVWEKAIKQLYKGNYDGSSSEEFWSWMRTIINSVACDFLRKHNAILDQASIDDTEYAFQAVRQSLEDKVINKIEYEKVWELIKGNLTDNQIEALYLQSIGYSSEEIAELVGSTDTAVRKRQQRGREKATQLFEDENPLDRFNF